MYRDGRLNQRAITNLDRMGEKNVGWRARKLIQPGLDRVGVWLAARGVKADHVTVAACVLGLVAAALIALVPDDCRTGADYCQPHRRWS
jgi:hypothetical protein